MKVSKIEITRAEGLSRLCGKTKVLASWDEARSFLFSQSDTFPEGGGYDKHDFKVTFEDGETYEGRLDCKHSSCSNPDLDVFQHILDYCIWYAGREKDPHCGVARYQEMMSQTTAEEIVEYSDFIDKYLTK